jgi:virginiamycin B lyase
LVYRTKWYLWQINTSTGQIKIFDAPKGSGPYGIKTKTPNGTVYFALLAGSYIARINSIKNDSAIVIEPPTADQGARRVWSDSQGKIWISEWNAGQLGMYNASNNKWKEWKLPGENPMPYAVYLDQKDMVWLTDFGSNAFVRFDPTNETFTVIKMPTPDANVRQILGVPVEIWGAESGADKIILIKTGRL